MRPFTPVIKPFSDLDWNFTGGFIHGVLPNHGPTVYNCFNIWKLQSIMINFTEHVFMMKSNKTKCRKYLWKTRIYDFYDFMRLVMVPEKIVNFTKPTLFRLIGQLPEIETLTIICIRVVPIECKKPFFDNSNCLGGDRIAKFDNVNDLVLF